jgi:CBS domain-containing protein
MKISKIMTPNVVVVSPNDNLQTAARKMLERDIGFLPVCDGERLIGTLSDRDIAIRAVSAGHDPRSAQVREFATPQAVWCFDDEDVDDAAQRCRTTRRGGYGA